MCSVFAVIHWLPEVTVATIIVTTASLRTVSSTELFSFTHHYPPRSTGRANFIKVSSKNLGSSSQRNLPSLHHQVNCIPDVIAHFEITFLGETCHSRENFVRHFHSHRVDQRHSFDVPFDQELQRPNFNPKGVTLIDLVIQQEVQNFKVFVNLVTSYYL